MILVTGATGQLGRLVIKSLLEQVSPKQIVAAVRDPAKAEDLKKLGVHVRRADYDHPEHWPAALKGVNKVLLISANEVGRRTAQHKVVVDAVKAAGTVKLLAYTSLLHADHSPLGLATEHRETEEMIRASGVKHTILRNGWYAENYLASAASAVQHGALHGAAGAGRIALATRAEYAEAAARVLAMDVGVKAVYELAGDVGYSLTELAAELAAASGKAVKYVNLSEPEYKALLIKVGLPEPVAQLLADSDAGAARGGLFDESHDLSRLVGHPTAPLAAVVKAALKAG